METRRLRIEFLRDRLERAHEEAARAERNLQSYARHAYPRADLVDMIRAVCEYRMQAVADWQAEWDLATGAQSLAA